MKDTPPPPPPSKPSHVQFSWEDWLPYLADSDATEDEKRQMIEALWSLVIAFVDLGLIVGEAPKNSCGQTLDLCAVLEAAVVHSKDTQQEEDLERVSAPEASKEDV